MKAFLFRRQIFLRRWRPIFFGLMVLAAIFFFLVWYYDSDFRSSGRFCDQGTELPRWSEIFTIASAIFTGASIISFAHLHESKTMNSFQHSYAKPKMARALRTLVDYRTANGDFFRIHRVASMNKNSRLVLPGVMAPNHWEEDVTDARRHIKFYFINALSLYVSGAISHTTFRRIVDKSAICVFFDIVEPIESMLNPFYNHTAYYQLMLLCSDIYRLHEEHDYISGGMRRDLPANSAPAATGTSDSNPSQQNTGTESGDAPDPPHPVA